MIRVTRTSPLSGKTRVRNIDVTEEQWTDWESGTLIQDAMPHLSASDREFLITGITDDEWNEMHKET